MQCAIYANSKSPHCCVVNCGQDDKKMTGRTQKWGLLPVMFAEPLFQVSGHKISQKYYTWYWHPKLRLVRFEVGLILILFLNGLGPITRLCRYGKDGKSAVRELMDVFVF